MLTRRSLLFFSLLCAALLAGGVRAARAEGDGVNRAGLVIRYADGTVQTQCVLFSEASLTGEELLQRSGLSVTMDYNAGLGGAVCSINNQGCFFPAQTQECFCQCQGASCEYWAYFHRTNTGWSYSSVGSSSYVVTNGALEGWSWGQGNFSSGVEPPALTFADVCLTPATATPTATATATASPRPTATRTSEPAVGSPPSVSFEAGSSDLTAGECTELHWNASDAAAVYLDDAPVLEQDQRQVCLAVTQRFVLRAINAAGQTTRELTVYVSQPDSSQPPSVIQATATRTPTMPTQAGATATPTPTAVFWSSAPTPTRTAAAGTSQPAAGAPTPGNLSAVLPGSAVYASEATPAAPALVQAVAAPAVLPESAPAPATPRPRRTLGSDGRPLPTPILQAYVPPASERAATGSADAGSAAAGMRAPGRSFSLALLPGYAAYLLTVAALAGVGARVTRRRTGGSRRG